MKTSELKIGKKVKLIPWKLALKLYKYESRDDHICVPYGDNSGEVIWVKSEYNEYVGKTLIIKGIDQDKDAVLKDGYCLQPGILRNAIAPISFKSILSRN